MSEWKKKSVWYFRSDGETVTGKPGRLFPKAEKLSDPPNIYKVQYLELEGALRDFYLERWIYKPSTDFEASIGLGEENRHDKYTDWKLVSQSNIDGDLFDFMAKLNDSLKTRNQSKA